MFLLRTLCALFLIGALLGSGLAQAAGSRIAILSDDRTMNRQLRHKLELGLRQTGITDIVSGDLQGVTSLPREMLHTSDFTLVVGQLALRHALQQGVRHNLLAVFLSQSALETELEQAGLRNVGARDIHAIVLDQPLYRYLDLIKMAFPQRQKIGMMVSNDASLPKNFEKQAQDRGLTLKVERWVSYPATESTSGFIATLETLMIQTDVFLALPDSQIHNSATVQPLLLTTYRFGIPVVAYSEAYGRAGALVSLYSTQEQLVRQAVDVMSQLRQGTHVSHILSPKNFTVMVNSTVARSLGLMLPAGDVLRDQLYQNEKMAD